jgi:hypothetical protein
VRRKKASKRRSKKTEMSARALESALGIKLPKLPKGSVKWGCAGPKRRGCGGGATAFKL